jgi:hypothetical protein
MSKTVDELMRLHLGACNAWTEVAQHSDGFEAANTADAALRSALEAVVEDAERLDALQSAKGHNQWIVAQGPGSFTVSLLRRGIASFATRKTIREAIDAAMQQAPEQEG